MTNQGMYRVVTRTTFVQKPTEAFPGRTRTLVYNFIHEYEAEDTWVELTNDAKITIPKNVYARDANGKPVQLGDALVNVGGFIQNAPLFMRGDRVTVEAGYRYFDKQNNEKLQLFTIFIGYVTMVGAKKPIVLECQDNMYALKQVIAPNKTYTSRDTLEDILRDLLKGTGFTVNALTETTLGEFITHNETVAEVLARLQKDYHLYSYFRGNELRCGSTVYIEQDAIDDGKKIFRFQQNIISDDLQYNRTQDIELSAVVYSINKVALNTVNKRGQLKTKHKRLEVLVTLRNGKLTSYTKPDHSLTSDYAPATSGERRTLYFWNVQTTEKLVELGAAELKKYYYTGFRGKFTTFGMPFVRQGDNVDLMDDVLPERNGRYKVRAVKYTGGINGLRQEIELEYLITRLDNKGNAIT